MPNTNIFAALLKLLTGEIEPVKGIVKRNPRLRMGIYNQHFVDRLPMNKTPVEHLRDRYQDQDYQSIRNRLGKYGLEGHAHEVTMRDLSGGQKARVVFVDLSLQVCLCVLLDYSLTRQASSGSIHLYPIHNYQGSTHLTTR